MAMKIMIIGPAYPYRGGIASFNQMLAHTFLRRGDRVEIVTFTMQYPGVLFPGRTQYSDSAPPEGLDIVRRVSSVNPINWQRTGRMVRREAPDLVIMKYWTPFMAPCLGRVARIARSNGHTRVIANVDNIVPHEHHTSDKLLNRYFVRSVDGFVYMSEQVGRELAEFNHGKPALFSPHPLYDNYGAPVSKREACAALGLDPTLQYSLFFGIVRDYKGLDILIDAWSVLRRRGLSAGRRLIVAGEFYEDSAKYIEQIRRAGVEDEIILHDRFIPDDLVRYYFSAADMLIQPYKSATQSGVTQIAYHFGLPMIVTDVGGLAEIVPDGVAGYVVRPDARSVAEAFATFYEGENAKRLRQGVESEKGRFSWDAMADTILRAFKMAGGSAAVPPGARE